MTVRDERFEAIYRKHYGRVYRFYRRCPVPDDEAHDLAQEVFKRFYEHMDQYRGEAEWRFLETIARRVLFNVIRARTTVKRNAKIVDLDDPEVTQEPAAPEEPDYAEKQQRALRRKLLHDAIAELPQGQRQCVELWLDGFQYDEIAGALRISMDAVKSRLRDTKKQLRARLGDDTIPEDEQ